MGQTLKNAGAKELNDHYERLVARLRARWINHHDAEDLAIGALCKGLDQENLHNPEGWLLTIARHGGITLSRRKKTAVKHREALAHHAARIREHAVVDPVAEAMRREESAIVAKFMTEALATLTALDREILEQSVIMCSTCDELAEWFNLTRAAVKGRLRRARKRLREYLEPRLYGRSGKIA